MGMVLKVLQTLVGPHLDFYDVQACLKSVFTQYEIIENR